MHLPNVVAMGVSELLCPDGSGMTHGVGDLIEVAAIVAVGDPDRLAITKAGGGGEAHRVGCV